MDETEEFVSLDELDFDDEVKPKRRGRPKGSKNKTTEDKAPASRRGRRSFKDSIGAQLTAINQLLLSFNGTRVFALTEVEGNMLIDGLDKVQREDARFKKYLEVSGKYGAYATLCAALGVYALRVLGDMGYIPKPGQVMADYNGSQIRPVYACEYCGQQASNGVAGKVVCNEHITRAIEELNASLDGTTPYVSSVTQ